MFPPQAPNERGFGVSACGLIQQDWQILLGGDGPVGYPNQN